MRIQTIEITNYKAFLGTHTIMVGGKNLFIYFSHNLTLKLRFAHVRPTDDYHRLECTQV